MTHRPFTEGAVLVTGATRGIGRAVADALHERGARVVGVARDAALLRELEGRRPQRFVGLARDLADPGARAGLARDAEAAVGPIDALVSAAGVVRYERALEVTRTALVEQLEVNLAAPLELAQAVARAARDAGRPASIVFVTSTLAIRAAESTLAYAATKAALEATMRGLALELAPSHIRVNAVAPGVVETDMVRVPRPGHDDPGAILKDLARAHPLGRLGSAEEVARAVLWLLDAAWVTGTSLVVDGGLTLR